jgi:uncharacterized protein
VQLRSESFADFIIRWRILFFAIALVFSLVGWWKSNSLDYDRSIESMFAPKNPVLVPYRKLKLTFGGNEIALAVYEDPELMAPDGSGIKRLEKIAAKLKKVDGVLDVLSLAEVNRALEQLYGPMNLVRRDAKPPIVNRDDPLAMEFVDIFEGYTHSADHKIVSIVCMLDPSLETERSETIFRIREIVDQLRKGRVTGEPAMVVDGFRYVEQDGQRLGWSSTILLALVIVISFRSVRWVIIPLVVMEFTLWSTQGILELAGFQLSMVSSMLHAIVTVISVATVVHIIVWYRAARMEGKSHEQSVHQSLSFLCAPVVWACITDAVGFAALMVADVGPVRDFGLMMALASLLVMINVMMVVPALALAGSRVSNRSQNWQGESPNPILGLTVNTVRKKPAGLAIVIFIVVGIASLGTLWMKVETDFTKNFRDSTRIAQAYQFVESRLGGAGVLDVVVPTKKEINFEFLKRVTQLEDDLRSLRFETGPQKGERALSKVISLADADRAARKLTVFKALPPEFILAGMSKVMPTFTSAMRSRDPDENGYYYFRIMLRTTQQQDAGQTRWLINNVQETVIKHFPETETQPSGQTTGFFVLLSELVNSILGDQLLTFAIAAICIFVSMTVAMRSIWLGFIALIPNLVPITFVLGTMGWLGIKINMGAAMIAAVSVGLSIDSSIHYLWSFRRQYKQTGSVAMAIDRAQQRVGRAASFSTLALVAGFLTLVISDFVPTVYFGVLVSVTMVGGLMGNLVLLPILLQLFYYHSSKDDAPKSNDPAPEAPASDK